MKRSVVEEARRHERAIGKYAEWFGGVHDDDCPGDDTCECNGKPINDGLNEACAFLLRLATAHEQSIALLREIVSRYDGYRKRGVMPAPDEYQLMVDAINAARVVVSGEES